MKIILATGIYPPDIGGPATYVRALAEEFSENGHQVTVISYGEQLPEDTQRWPVIRVSKQGGPFLRWRRYRNALRRHAADADIVYAFSLVSAGVPLAFATLKKPKHVLRLGGDFFWERYTDRGGSRGLIEWYRSVSPLRRLRFLSAPLLKQFDHIIFSTAFQKDLYTKEYSELPASSVVENAQPSAHVSVPHTPHSPFRLLAFGRLVRFKNFGSLIQAVASLKDISLTVVGDGPVRFELQALAEKLELDAEVTFVDAVHGDDKKKLFDSHDLLVLPSTTEISPNAALEARASGLPVLLTQETGLSATLSDGMALAELRTPEQLVKAITDIRGAYEQRAQAATKPLPPRGWDTVAAEHEALFTKLAT